MDTLAVRPLDAPPDAEVVVPGSKSIANRALVCAALAGGSSILHGVPDGDDTAALLECLAALGAGLRLDASDAHVDGCGGELNPGPLTLDARLAGTTSRFVTALAALGEGPYVVDGDGALRRRPMGPLHEALAALGATVRPVGEAGHLPVEVSGPITRSAVALRGDVSSQYVTALMLAAPCLPAGLRIELTSRLVSRPYVEMTVAVQRSFGASVDAGQRSIAVGPGGYTATDYTIEPDGSSASYVLAAAAVCGGRVRVPGLTDRSIQGDAGFALLLARMGAAAEFDGGGVTVHPAGPLQGIDVDMAGCSDLVPTLAVVAAFAATPTTIRGVGFIRAKESDRIGDLCTELRRAGIDASEHLDGLTIAPSAPHAARLDTHHDHRLAMAFAVLGLRVPGIEIAEPGVVSKSWPGFWDALEGLR